MDQGLQDKDKGRHKRINICNQSCRPPGGPFDDALCQPNQPTPKRFASGELDHVLFLTSRLIPATLRPNLLKLPSVKHEVLADHGRCEKASRSQDVTTFGCQIIRLPTASSMLFAATNSTPFAQPLKQWSCGGHRKRRDVEPCRSVRTDRGGQDTLSIIRYRR